MLHRCNMEIGYQAVLQYLSSGTYPISSTSNNKRAIRAKSAKFVLDSGVLFLVQKDHPRRQWISSREQQQNILFACHSDKLGGHFGRDKTREKITSRYTHSLMIIMVNKHNLMHCVQSQCALQHSLYYRYYWSNITKDIDTFVRTCTVCQKQNKQLTSMPEAKQATDQTCSYASSNPSCWSLAPCGH